MLEDTKQVLNSLNITGNQNLILKCHKFFFVLNSLNITGNQNVKVNNKKILQVLNSLNITGNQNYNDYVKN